jgi:acetyl-CoA C-acetyltransferase
MSGREPCLVGWSQLCRFPGEPLHAWAEALVGTGVPPGRIDTLDVVYCQSWQYDDPPGRLAARVGAAPRLARYSGIGGTTPLVLVAEAAERILAGEADVCAVVGGEALDTVRRLKKAGERPAWSHRDPERTPFPFEAPFHPAEVAHQLFQAYSTFAVRDIARRAQVGTPPAEHLEALGELFAPMTKVAAANPHAWFPVERSAVELATPTPDNRMVAYPYTKLLMSVMDVDVAGAVVLATRDAADALGIAPERRVHLRGWGYATDPVYVAEHDDLGCSPAMGTAFGAALRGAGVDVDDIAHLDLYSCFPSSVAFALDALGLAADDRRAPFTVTGGLPFAGGAGSCYLLPAMAAMADVLVEDPGSLGMTTGVGMHMTKHAAAVWATTPGGVEPPPPDAGPAARRPIVDVHLGPASVAAYTVHHGRDGAATDAVLVCDIEGATGARCYAKAFEAGLLDALEQEEWVGRRVELVDGGEGVNLVGAG